MGQHQELPPEGRLRAAADAGRNGEQDFHGPKRSNETHASTTDPDARLYRKGRGKEAKLCFIGHALRENRHGLIVGAVATRASGHAERLAALHVVKPHAERSRPITLGGDKGFDTQDFVAELREINVTPHVAQNVSGRRSAIDGRTTRHAGYAIACASASGSRRPSAGPRPLPDCARRDTADCPRSIGSSPLPMAAYNLVRLPKLLGAVA